jgi:hypothetical protein
MTPDEERSFTFADELLAFAIALITAAPAPPVTRDTRRDPAMVGRTLLCRSITNFRGALVLAREDHPVESRALVRMIFENFFFVAALCDHGADFVRQMRSDEAANRKALGELSLQNLADKEGEYSTIIRTNIRKLLTEFPKPKKFGSVNAVAASTVARRAYLSYAILSVDGHPSVSSLRRYLQWEQEGDSHYLTLNVIPRFTEKERLATIDEACSALLGVCVGFNQLLDGTPKNDELRVFFERFEAQGRHAAGIPADNAPA